MAEQLHCSGVFLLKTTVHRYMLISLLYLNLPLRNKIASIQVLASKNTKV